MQGQATTHPHTKLQIRVNYAGREHPFHPKFEETVLAARSEAMDFFKIVADRDRLRLYRMDNTELNDHAAIGAYNLAKHEVLILRQPQGGGYRC
ncbi:MAG: hypothetical protein H0U12_12730 [Thermoleophilaceae bacterium]|nr:hypothetical protein [Thermoleophilaceae bacterium]